MAGLLRYDEVLARKDLLDAMALPAYVCDRDHRIQYANPAFLELADMRPRELRSGPRCPEAVGLSVDGAPCAADRSRALGERVTYAEIAGRTAKAKALLVTVTSVPLYDGADTIVGGLQQLLDLSVERQIHLKYRAVLENERADRIEAELRKEDMMEEIQRLKVLQKEANRLREQVEALDATDPQPMEVPALLEEADRWLRLTEPGAAEAAFLRDLAPTLPAVLVYRELAAELLGRVLAFGGNRVIGMGEVAVRVRPDAGGSAVRFEVADRGPDLVSGERPGSASVIARALGGRLTVQGGAGQGGLVSLWLPAHRP